MIPAYYQSPRGRLLDCDFEPKLAKSRDPLFSLVGGRGRQGQARIFVFDCDLKSKAGKIQKSHIVGKRFLDCDSESKVS